MFPKHQYSVNTVIDIGIGKLKEAYIEIFRRL